MERITADKLQGYCSESGAWQFLHDVAGSLVQIHAKGNAHCGVTLSNVYLDGEYFVLGDSVADGCGSLEDDVWALGASVFLLLMGKPVFYGENGRKQSATTKIPRYLSGFSERISAMVYRCLQYNPLERPLPEEVFETAAKMLEQFPPARKERRKVGNTNMDDICNSQDEFWPEEMVN